MKNKIGVLFNTMFLWVLNMFTTVKHTFAKDALDRVIEEMNFEANNFENFDAHSALNLTSAEIGGVRKAMPAIMKKVKEGGGGITIYGQGASPEIVHQLEMRSVGDVNLTITRVTANITEGGIPTPLPVVLFGSNDYQAGYVGSLSSVLPTGITASVAKDSLGNVVFTYVRTSDSATDTIKVQNLGNISYATFLAGMNNNYFKSVYFKLFLANDSYINTQFAQPFLFGLLSQLGAKNFNQLVMRSRIHSWQYLAYVLEVLMPEQSVVPDFQFIWNVVGGAGYSIGFDMFMSERGNLNKLLNK